MKPEMMKRVLLISLTSLVALAGCHSFKKENVQPPTPLAKDFKPTVQVTKVWSARVGEGAGKSGVRLRPTVVDGVLYADSTDGKLAAFDANSGKTLWSKSTRTHGWFGWGDKKRQDAMYAGGPAVEGDLLAVGTLDGHVYGVSAKDGSPRWDTELAGQVLASPVISGDLVLVRCSVGRYRDVADLQRSDDELIAGALRDLAAAVGVRGTPVDALVTRWGGALPQYGVGHLDRVARIKAAVAMAGSAAGGAATGGFAAGRFAVCGAAYDGVGIPACIGGGRAAATQVLAGLFGEGE